MPEHNFEQQARDMVHGFEKEPKPEVWQNVRTAIQQPQRKRRFALWWWLLPLAILGGSVVYFMLNQKTKITQVAKVNSIQQKAAAQTSLEAPHKQQLTTTKQDEQKQQKPIITTKKNDSNNQPQSTSINTANGIFNKEEETQQVLNKDITTVDKPNKPVTIADEKLSKNESNFLPLTDNKNATAIDSIDALKEQLQLLSKDSLNNLLKEQDSSALSRAISQSDSTKNITPKKQKKHQPLQWGMVAEGGIATRKSITFPLASFNKSDYLRAPLPTTNGTGSTVTGLPGSNGFYYNNYNIKPGAAFGVGIALQKPISRSIDLFANAAYHYQSFKVETTAYQDSLVLNFNFSTVAGNYEAAQTFHFASLLAGINWHFINTKHIQLGISTGIDNLYLVATKQKINGINTSSLSLADAVQTNAGFFSVSSFNKYQPSLFAGLLVNIKTNGQQWQLQPFTRTSFATFDKNATSSNNHLFSAGLRAAYFFK